MPLTADSDVTKTLGVVWLPGRDYFQFRLYSSFLDHRATKRNTLSVAARLFGPLALLCPLVTRAKMLLQELWLRKIVWADATADILGSFQGNAVAAFQNQGIAIR